MSKGYIQLVHIYIVMHHPIIILHSNFLHVRLKVYKQQHLQSDCNHNILQWLITLSNAGRDHWYNMMNCMSLHSAELWNKHMDLQQQAIEDSVFVANYGLLHNSYGGWRAMGWVGYRTRSGGVAVKMGDGRYAVMQCKACLLPMVQTMLHANTQLCNNKNVRTIKYVLLGYLHVCFVANGKICNLGINTLWRNQAHEKKPWQLNSRIRALSATHQCI